LDRGEPSEKKEIRSQSWSSIFGARQEIPFRHPIPVTAEWLKNVEHNTATGTFRQKFNLVLNHNHRVLGFRTGSARVESDLCLVGMRFPAPLETGCVRPDIPERHLIPRKSGIQRARGLSTIPSADTISTLAYIVWLI
jgi:hypothetical protein